MTSQIQVNLNPQPVSSMTPRSGRTTPRHCQKMEEWMVPQCLGWSSHSLTYEFTPKAKPSHTAFHVETFALCNSPHPAECVSLWILTNPISYLSLCISLNFCNETSEPELHYVLKPGTMGFGRGLKSWERAEGWEGKAVGKTCREIPFMCL